MLFAYRKASIILSGFLVTSAVMAATGGQPQGFWILDNTSQEMPFGGLNLTITDQFELLIYDNDCKLYTVDGSIKRKTTNSWELKNSVDYSNTFTMTLKEKKLQLVDTEDQTLLFYESTREKLNRDIKPFCTNHSDKKVNK